MAATPSTMIPIGTTMPSFSLPDAKEIMRSPSSTTSGTLVVFMCNHCPFVIHVAKVLSEMHAKCETAGIEMYGINSNDIEAYPDDRPEQMVKTASKYDWTFPYLFDATQEVAKLFGAVCTPDVFLYDRNMKLFYRGQLDDSRPDDDSIPDGRDLQHAIDQMIDGNPPPSEQKPAIGCSIKWRQ